jgi:hypothetical protein
MSKKLVALCIAVFLVSISIEAFAGEASPNREISEKLVGQTDSPWIRDSFRASPDNKHVAYTAQVGNKQWVVVDGKEGTQYDGVVLVGGGRIGFASFDSLDYLAAKGSSIYFVKEKIKVNSSAH